MRILFAFLVGFCFFVNSALACESAGPNMHVGPVTGIDEAAKTFTILDAETQKNIEFNASKEILKTVASKKQVIVEYHKDEKGLLALSVK